jgi:NADP-dependent aldehyde dehydrogenase
MIFISKIALPSRGMIMTNLTGHLLIGASDVPATAGTMKALNPSTNLEIEPEFAFGGEAEVDRAVRLADEAFDSYNATTLQARAAFLERIADGLDRAAPELAERTSLETGLPVAQLQGETAKAATNFRKFAAVVRQGRFREAAIDPAQPDRKPLPRMDHRLQKIGVGPIAIFGASNFPISYSVAGGDTASALAAGCPVVLKAHNAHPGSSEIQGRVIREAVRASGLHEGVFSLVRGDGNGVGEALVKHPLIRGVAFTGSEGGGMALYRLAQQRPDPIPVFAEMTSVNPTFILPAALTSRAHAIGDGFTERMLVTVGQACLKPAIIIAVDAPGFELMRQAMIDRVAAGPARTMLTPGINQAYRANVQRLEKAGARRIAEGAPESGEWDGRAVLFEVEGAQFLAEPLLAEEVFGPSALLVKAKDLDELMAIARTFRGQLSATMHLERDDLAIAGRLLPILERRTGRIVVNAFAHPQEVGYSTIHGGPFPATTDSRFTSVGMTAIERFLRPVCYQGFPDDLLPEALKAANPLGLPRLVDGELSPE